MMMMNKDKEVIKIKLTTEQQKLVEDNQKIVLYYLNKYKLFRQKDVVEDLYGACNIALCEAALKYDAEKYNCTFSSFASICIKYQINNIIAKSKKRQGIIGSVYRLNDTISNEAESEFINYIPDKNTGLFTDDVDFMYCFHKVYDKLEDSHKKVISLITKGYTQVEASYAVGDLSIQKVGRIVRAFREKLYKELYAK